MHNADDSRIALPLADENATVALAARLARCLVPGLVIHLHGDLGAGKTCLVRGVLNALGHTGRVKSPTYTLLETYHAGGLDLRHFDLYRLHDEDEWEAAGFRDEAGGDNVLLVEWPERAQNVLPKADIVIDLKILPNGRLATLTGLTPTGKKCLQQL